MRKGGLLLGLTLGCLTLAQEHSARSLFMSTAGSEVIYKQETTVRTEKQTRVKREASTPRPQVYYGMSLQVYANKNGRLVPVDFRSYTFRTGDRFKVKVTYNSPGIVEFVNIDPEGRENYLGNWVVEEAFTGTMLPAEGSFKFTGTKGRELLIVRFFPCRPEDRDMVREINVSSSRAIQFVRDEDIKPASFGAELSACNPNRIKRHGGYSEYTTASSRSIMVVHEQVEKRTYYFVSQENYQRGEEPIVAVLEFKHR